MFHYIIAEKIKDAYLTHFLYKKQSSHCNLVLI